MSQYSRLELQAVTDQDTDLLLELMAGFNQEEKIDFDPASYRECIRRALNLPQFVNLWLVVADCSVVGYVVLTFTFSFEFGGLLATIDEIYLAPDHRGKGLGTATLDLIAQAATQRGATTLCGDIADDKPWLAAFYTRLAAFYKRAGFEGYPYRPYYKTLR